MCLFFSLDDQLLIISLLKTYKIKFSLFGVFDRGLKNPELFKTMHSEGKNIWSGRMRNHDSWPGTPTKSMVADSQHACSCWAVELFSFFYFHLRMLLQRQMKSSYRRWLLISSTCVKCGALLGSCILKHFSRYCPDYFLQMKNFVMQRNKPFLSLT